MSLYDDVARAISRQGLISTVRGGINDAGAGLGKGIQTVLGGSKTAGVFGAAAGTIASQAATQVLNKYIPPQLEQNINLGGAAIGDIMRGDWDMAGVRILEGGALDFIYGGFAGLATQARYWGTPTRLFGGITPREAYDLWAESHAIPWAKKNLFLVEISSANGRFDQFNLYVTQCEFSPTTLTGEYLPIGMTVADILKSSDPVELRITTMDDQYGTIRRWWQDRFNTSAPMDGTAGVPADYAVRFKIVHAYITKASSRGRGYEEIGLFRPQNLDVSLSRSEDAIEELTMTFAQIDPFMS